jgi:uncharacterized protein YbbC (DUF1343 family)
MDGWRRSMWFDATGLAWVNPSPNIRTLNTATLYPGLVLFEGTNLSVGRGTDGPFEWIGAPWLDAAAWAARLSASGVRFTAEDRTPDATAEKYANQACQGLRIEIGDRQRLQPMALAVAMLATVGSKLQFRVETFDALAGTNRLRTRLEAGASPDDIVASWRTELDRFLRTRQQYLLY